MRHVNIFLVPFDGREIVLEKSREARWMVINLKELENVTE